MSAAISSPSVAGRAVMACRDLAARYNRITVVAGVGITLEAGKMLAILGPNGAGKSSMLGSIAGTVSGSGRIEVDGVAIDGLPTHRRATRGISLVPEQRRNVFPTMSVSENIEIGLRLLPTDARDGQREQIFALFPILRERQTATASMLSGGEQQMLAIGLALGRKPRVLILDEPSQGLAPAVFDTLEHAFDTLKAQGLALLLAEQNVPFAARVADSYLILSQGRIVRQGGKADLADPESIAEAFLGTRE